MRWKAKEVVYTVPGATREVTRFLWLPTCLVTEYGCRQWRWLELATIKQVYTTVGATEGGGAVYGWKDAEFLRVRVSP